jgi:hypothetical protein
MDEEEDKVEKNKKEKKMSESMTGGVHWLQMRFTFTLLCCPPSQIFSPFIQTKVGTNSSQPKSTNQT